MCDRVNSALLVCFRHEVPVTSDPITIVHMDEDIVVVNKPASIPVSGQQDCLSLSHKFIVLFCAALQINLWFLLNHLLIP